MRGVIGFLRLRATRANGGTLGLFSEDELSKLIPGFLKDFHARQMKSGKSEASLSQSFVTFLR